MTLGKKNGRAACPKEMLKFFRARLMYVVLQLYESVRKELGSSALSFISDLQRTFFE